MPIVSVREWENQEDSAVTYYRVSARTLRAVRSLVLRQRTNAARDVIMRCGKKVVPEVRVEVDVF